MTPADRHPIAPPPGPWVMVQRWHELLFAHWRCAMSDLRTLVPPPLESETFDGTPRIGVSPFYMTGVRMRAMPPVPHLRHARWASGRVVLQPRRRVDAGRHRRPARYPATVLSRINGDDLRGGCHPLHKQALVDRRPFCILRGDVSGNGTGRAGRAGHARTLSYRSLRALCIERKSAVAGGYLSSALEHPGGIGAHRSQLDDRRGPRPSGG